MWEELRLVLLSGELWWLLLLVPVVLGLFLWKRPRGGYIVKAHSPSVQSPAKARFRGALAPAFAFLGLVLLVAALADFTRGYAVVKELLAMNRLFVAVDNSSSMYDFNYPVAENENTPIYCANKNLRVTFPLIFGACQALYRLVDGVEAYTKGKSDAEKSSIALTRFALYSFVVTQLTEDYAKVRRDINTWEWGAQIKHSDKVGGKRDIFTEIHLALWSLFSLALERNAEKVSGFVPLSFEDMTALVDALAPDGERTPFSLPSRFKDTFGKDGERIPGIALRLKEELRDTVFVIITDANEGQFSQRIDARPVSVRKLLGFAAAIELPVYFVSTDYLHEEYRRMARETGFTYDGVDYHGDLVVANYADGYASLGTLIEKILAVRFGRMIPVQTERRVSYAAPLAFLSLTCFALGIFFRETIGRSLTDV